MIFYLYFGEFHGNNLAIIVVSRVRYHFILYYVALIADTISLFLFAILNKIRLYIICENAFFILGRILIFKVHNGHLPFLANLVLRSKLFRQY